MRTVNSLIGSPIERVEDLRFLRGRGQYVDDLSREGLLHAAILRSSVAHGRIRSLDVSAALALPGVHSVITAKDIGNRVPRVPMRLQPLPDFEAAMRERTRLLKFGPRDPALPRMRWA